MEHSSLVVAALAAEMLVATAALYLLLRRLGALRVSAAIPLYSIVTISSAVAPVRFDALYGLALNYFALIAAFSITYLRCKSRAFLAHGFVYLILYFLLCTVPYSLTNCSTYTLACIYVREARFEVLEYVVFALGVALMISLTSIVSQYDRVEHAIFHALSTIYGLTHFLFLLEAIHPLLLSALALLLLALTYYFGELLGQYLFAGEREVERVFDKYVSLNAPSVLALAALALAYGALWG